jgi:cell division protein FtsB
VNVDVGIFGRLTRRVIVVLIFVAGLLLVSRWYLPLIQENERARKEIGRLENQVQKEQALGRQFNGAIQAISTDPKTVERLARENLGYAKPGETVVRFSAPATNAPRVR